MEAFFLFVGEKNTCEEHTLFPEPLAQTHTHMRTEEEALVGVCGDNYLPCDLLHIPCPPSAISPEAVCGPAEGRVYTAPETQTC